MRRPFASSLAVLAGLAAIGGGSACASRGGWLTDMRQGAAQKSVHHHAAARREFESSLRTAEHLDPSRRSHTWGPDRAVLIARSLFALADLDELEGQWGAADAGYARALAVVTAAKPPDSAIQAAALSGLRRAALHQGRFQEAEELQERCLGRLDRRSPERNRNLARAHAEYARELADVGRYFEALAEWQRSFERADADGPPRVDRAPQLSDYARVLEALGRDDEAAGARARAEALVAGSTYVQHVLFGNEFQAIVVRWTVEDMPLRVRIETPRSSEVRHPQAATELAREAVQSWRDVVSPGLPRFDFIDEGRGDIVVRWHRDRYGELWAGVCRHNARWSDDPLERAKVTILSRVMGSYRSDEELRFLIVHEIGHALGLLGHSELESDVMYPSLNRVLVQSPSDRDMRTLRELYRQEPGQSYSR